MPEGHVIEHLEAAADLRVPMALHAETATRWQDFAQGPALTIVDELFNEFSGPDEIWRLSSLDLDLGDVNDLGPDLERIWARRLREVLRKRLVDLRGPTGAAAAVPGLRSRAASRLDLLLHFLRHGRLPWHGRGEDPMTLAAEVLRDHGAALAAALRRMDDRPRMLRRMVAQFDREWLAALVHLLMPGEPGAARRLLDSVSPSGLGGHAPAGTWTLWMALLDEAMAHGGGAKPAATALWRAQLVAALEAGDGFSSANDPLLAVASVWDPLLRDDRAWLKQTLQRYGRTDALRQRLVMALPAAVLPQLLTLWLGDALQVAVHRWIDTVTAGTPASAADTAERRQWLWQATLDHALRGETARFDAERYAAQVIHHVGTVSPPGREAPRRWFDRVAKAATSVLSAAAAALRLRWRPNAEPTLDDGLEGDGLNEAEAPAPLEAMSVENAGLVLLSPYLPRLFSMLDLGTERAFHSEASAIRGVLVLQLLATGQTDAPEPSLLLNKLLCGLDLALPVPRDWTPTAAERQAVDGLLGAVIQHWRALGSTSVGGLQGTFLRRLGRLSRERGDEDAGDSEAWRLAVEPGTFDMLIDRLPWGYSTVKFPWMERVLHVDWR
ncbi:contractile injection system tape measure protein [Roseateles amylovorans]|uniref:Contractile injection system tape measure protein n=1 Tax=Roseateles amylovorans TaxID=2978473 RepID=A0ABY6B876_9BURK|nr:contractile injection system tape measure protein [Roseateles amylovorans]UXH79416.1 contractile injection system tape measure protein [Roseateles amylovorans]